MNSLVLLAYIQPIVEQLSLEPVFSLTCAATDPCTGANDCDHPELCSEATGSPVCFCPQGFELGADEKTCSGELPYTRVVSPQRLTLMPSLV